MSKIRILLWDIDGTVMNFLEAEKAAIRKGFSCMGLGECTDKMLLEYSSINKKYWQILEKGEMTKQEILTARFREFFSNNNIDVALAEKFNAQYQIDLGDTVCFNDNSYELIVSLKEKYKQYAVSNGTKIAQDKKLRNSGLDKIFDGIYISEEIGYEKPNIKFFDKVFENINASIGEFQKDEVLIIGDSLTSDIKGGNNASIICCWYNRDCVENTDGNLKIDYVISDLNELEDILND